MGSGLCKQGRIQNQCWRRPISSNFDAQIHAWQVWSGNCKKIVSLVFCVVLLMMFGLSGKPAIVRWDVDFDCDWCVYRESRESFPGWAWSVLPDFIICSLVVIASIQIVLVSLSASVADLALRWICGESTFPASLPWHSNAELFFVFWSARCHAFAVAAAPFIWASESSSQSTSMCCFICCSLFGQSGVFWNQLTVRHERRELLNGRNWYEQELVAYQTLISEEPYGKLAGNNFSAPCGGNPRCAFLLEASAQRHLFADVGLGGVLDF